MKIKYLHAACFIALLGSASLSSAVEIPCPKYTDNCREYAEKTLIKKYPTLFKRINGKLIISLSNGSKKVYLTSKINEHVDEIHNLDQYYPEIGYALVSYEQHESGWYLLVNLKTGKDFVITNPPTISPDKKRIAVTNHDLESGYTSNDLSVYRLGSNAVVKEYEISPDNWGADDERWISNTEISFTKLTYEDYKYKKEFKKLKYISAENSKKGTWRIE